jgi:beta-lactamase regulating signal transducer with metallopeptidase domain
MTVGTLHLLSQGFAEQLAVCLVGGTAVVALAWVLLRAAVQHDAEVRFRIWFSVLVAIGGLLLLGSIHTQGPSAVPAANVRNALLEISPAWAVYGFVAWLAVVFVALLRIGAGLWQVWRLKQSCVPIDASKFDSETLSWLTNTRRRVLIRVSDRAAIPTAVGLGTPTIVLPGWALRDLSATDLKQVVLHELAHLQRWDDWTNLAQKVLRALLFFHPLVWWVETRLTLEREMACDDAVLRRTQNPRAYAECLATVAEKSLARRTVVLAQAAVGKIRQTSFRVARILHLGQDTQTRRWVPGAAFIVIASVAGTLMSYGPKLIGFDAPEPFGSASQMSAQQAPVQFRDFDQANSARSNNGVARVVAASARAGKHTNSAVNNVIINPGRQSSSQVLKTKYVPQHRASLARNTAFHQPAHIAEPAVVEQAVFVVFGDGAGQQTVVWHMAWRITYSAEQRPVRGATAPDPIRSEITAKKS